MAGAADAGRRHPPGSLAARAGQAITPWTSTGWLFRHLGQKKFAREQPGWICMVVTLVS